MVKAVLFDMDGVVLDSEKLYTRFWKQAIEESGFSVTWEQLLDLRSLGKEFAPAYFREILGPSADPEAIRILRRVRMKEYTDVHPIQLKPGIRKTLEELRKRKILTAIATASNPERAEGFLDQTGVRPLFDRVLTTASVAHGKPEPDIYLSACQQLGIEPWEAMAVEDSDNGALSAIRAGCLTVMVPDLAPPGAQVVDQLYGVAGNVAEILDLL